MDRPGVDFFKSYEFWGPVGYSRWPLAVNIVKMEDPVEKYIKDFLL